MARLTKYRARKDVAAAPAMFSATWGVNSDFARFAVMLAPSGERHHTLHMDQNEAVRFACFVARIIVDPTRVVGKLSDTEQAQYLLRLGAALKMGIVKQDG